VADEVGNEHDRRTALRVPGHERVAQRVQSRLDPVRIGGDVRYTITGMSYDATSDMTTWIVTPVESGESAA
jgi:hypothetical protein